jgi:hypothetical protein
MMRSVQEFIWDRVEVGHCLNLMDFGKMAESQNKKIGHSKKLRIKEIPVGFRYKFEWKP